MICKNCKNKSIARGIKQIKCFKCDKKTLVNYAYSNICSECSDNLNICQYCGEVIKKQTCYICGSKLSPATININGIELNAMECTNNCIEDKTLTTIINAGELKKLNN